MVRSNTSSRDQPGDGRGDAKRRFSRPAFPERKSRPASSAATETARTSIIPARQASDGKGCKMRRFLTGPGLVAAALATAVLVAVPLALALNSDTEVTAGSPASPFSENKQNEPALAVDASNPTARRRCNEEIDVEACNAGDDTTCPFTPGIGVSATTSRSTAATLDAADVHRAHRPDCQGAVGNSDPGSTATAGADRDAAEVLGERARLGRRPRGRFGPGGAAPATSRGRTDRGSTTRTSPRTWRARAEPDVQGLRGDRGLANGQRAGRGRGDATLVRTPVLVSKQSSTTFADKEQIWADNASSSPFFGTVYVCGRLPAGQRTRPRPAHVAVSHDGGDSGNSSRPSAAANNGQNNPADGCTVRTDSEGKAYVFGVGTSLAGKAGVRVHVRSRTAARAGRSRPGGRPGHAAGVVDPVLGRPTIDGVAGAHSDLAPAPSVDIANGAPTGGDATDRMVMTYVSGDSPSRTCTSPSRPTAGKTWSTPVRSRRRDRGLYTAPAISPNGKDVTSSTTRSRRRFARTRPSRAHSSASSCTRTLGNGAHGNRSDQSCIVHAGRPTRVGSERPDGEFLGDLVYAVATRTSGSGRLERHGARRTARRSTPGGLARGPRNTSTATPAPQQD